MRVYAARSSHAEHVLVRTLLHILTRQREATCILVGVWGNSVKARQGPGEPLIHASYKGSVTARYLGLTSESRACPAEWAL